MTARRGEVWYADLNPVRGSEQAGRRPVLDFQDNTVSRFTTTLVTIPFTSNMRRASLPTCVLVSAGEGGLTGESVLICHQMRSIDVQRLGTKLGTISDKTMMNVEDCVLFTLGIELSGGSGI